MPQVKDGKNCISRRAQAMALLEYGVHVEEVMVITKFSINTLYYMKRRLRERGYNPEVETTFEDHFFKDAPRSGRPRDPDSQRSKKRDAARQKALEVASKHQAGIDQEPFPPADEIVTTEPRPDGSATATSSIFNVNYRPAPYRRQLDLKIRPVIPPGANPVFIGKEWIMPIAPSQASVFPNEILSSPRPVCQHAAEVAAPESQNEDTVSEARAGVTDSALTNHGVLQAKRLGTYLSTRFRFTHIFSSDLQRAYKTALAIQQAQQEKHSEQLGVFQLKILQEQNFGSFEKMTFAARARAAEGSLEALEPPETKEAMAIRANQFLADYLLPILFSESDEEKVEVAVVSHGLLLSTLWRYLLKRFPPSNVEVAHGIEIPVRDMQSLEHLGAWTNTGYLELLIETTSSWLENSTSTSGPETSEALTNYKLTIVGINNKEHLRGLKRTGGGVGSSKHDETQKSIESFFKKPKTG